MKRTQKSKGMKKHIRMQKARIRKQGLSPERQKQEIQKIIGALGKK